MTRFFTSTNFQTMGPSIQNVFKDLDFHKLSFVTSLCSFHWCHFQDSTTYWGENRKTNHWAQVSTLFKPFLHHKSLTDSFRSFQPFRSKAALSLNKIFLQTFLVMSKFEMTLLLPSQSLQEWKNYILPSRRICFQTLFKLSRTLRSNIQSPLPLWEVWVKTWSNSQSTSAWSLHTGHIHHLCSIFSSGETWLIWTRKLLFISNKPCKKTSSKFSIQSPFSMSSATFVTNTQTSWTTSTFLYHWKQR